MTLKTKTTSLIALIAALTFGFGCAAEEEITQAANEVEAGLLQDQLDAVVAGGARGAILFVDDPNSDPIELSAGVSSARAEASMEEATSSLEADEGLVDHGEERCGEWDGNDASAPDYFSLARLMDSGRRVVLLVDSAGLDDTTEPPEARAAILDLVESAQCR